MKQPTIKLLPIRPAVRSDASTVLDVLVHITPPAADPGTARPTLNLGIVIDRSGSMDEARKLNCAREAAAFAVKELVPGDRVSLTVFDDKVDTLAPNAPVGDRARLLALIAGVQPGGSTALHGGWAEGANQVAAGRVPGGLNRVLLLSDGLANVGESRPDAIANGVHARLGTGVSTSTMGLGNDYNEDLLEAMARSGDGNYYYVESPRQLAAVFAAELTGLTATAGTDVLLAADPGAGGAASEVLNDLDRAADGRLRLPNLVAGFPVLVALRFTVPPTAGEARVCAVRLDWAAPGATERQALTAELVLPAVAASAWEALAPDLDVQEKVVLLTVARLKKGVTDALARGDAAGARACLAQARALLQSVPATLEVDAEIVAVADLDRQIEAGDHMGTLKRAKFEAHNRRYSKPTARREED